MCAEFADVPHDKTSVICLPCTHLLGSDVTLKRSKRSSHIQDVQRHHRAVPAWKESLQVKSAEPSDVAPARLILAREFDWTEQSASQNNHDHAARTSVDAFPNLVEAPDRFEDADRRRILFSAGQSREDHELAQLARDYNALLLYDHEVFSSNVRQSEQSPHCDETDDTTIADAVAAMAGEVALC
jgi:hypothetical protein